MFLPRRDEPFRDASLIEHLDGAGVKTPGSRSVDILVGASFDDELGTAEGPWSSSSGRATPSWCARSMAGRRVGASSLIDSAAEVTFGCPPTRSWP
jgi:hypothetical protein